MGLPTVPDRALDRLYSLPRETASLEEWHRRRQLDLAELSDLDLDREAFGVAMRLYRDRDPARVTWLVARREAIRAERRRRADAPYSGLTYLDGTAITLRRSARSTHGAPRLVVRRCGETIELG